MSRTSEPTHRVLVVEDEPAISESISYALETEGMAVEAAYTFSEALAQVRRRPPSLVLLDVMLPGGSGLDICREEKRLRWYDPATRRYLRTFDEEAEDRLAAENRRLRGYG